MVPQCLDLDETGYGDGMAPAMIRARRVLWMLVLAFLAVPPSRVSALNCLRNQSSALLKFKQGLSLTDPDALISWQDQSDCCSWHGVTCNPSTGFVVSLKLSGVTNSFPPVQTQPKFSSFGPSIFDLPQLYDLDLSYNLFEGPIPSGLGELAELVHLNLSDAGFSGSIPKSLGNLHQLESLDLSRNSLSGNIPTELVDLTFLSVLNLSFNQLEGPIPQGNQFSTFCAQSFTGNPGLRGTQLSIGCTDSGENGARNVAGKGKAIFEPFMYVPAELGFVTGLAAVLVPLLTVVRVRNWWLTLVDGFAEALLSKANPN
ncbi:unnamed protein product [Victoria cruziana]